MFVQLKSVPKDYGLSIDRRLKNTLNFENCSNQILYRNPDMSIVDTTSRSLRLYDNVVLTTLIDTIKSTSALRSFNEEEVQKYRYRPHRLCMDIYGVTDYWWILLAVNGMMSVYDFENFSILLIPEESTIQMEVDAELYSHPVKFVQ